MTIPKNTEKWVAATPHPTDEDKKMVWDNWQEFGGWVYVAKVNGFDEWWKIGHSARKNVCIRVNELNTSVASREEYDLVWTVRYANRFKAERLTHALLAQMGAHRGKEFFEAPFDVVKKVLQRVVEAEDYAWAGWNVNTFRGGASEKSWRFDAFDWVAWWERFGDRDAFI